MNTRLLNLFLAVVQHGGFAQAARSLDMDPSVVSRSIAGLEDELGVRLFQRTTRKVTLTEAGARFAARVEPLLTEFEQAREEVLSDDMLPKGKLRFSTSVAFGHVAVMPIIPKFLDQYPDIDLDLVFTDRNVDMVAENIDLAIRLGPSIEGDLIVSKLIDTQYRVCASPTYLRDTIEAKTPSDLEAHRCICFDLPAYRTSWSFRAPTGAESEVPIKPRLRISGALALREAALAGLGPALLADWLIGDDIAEGRLTDMFPGYQATATGFDTAAWLVYPSRTYLPRKTRILIDFLRANLNRNMRPAPQLKRPSKSS